MEKVTGQSLPLRDLLRQPAEASFMDISIFRGEITSCIVTRIVSSSTLTDIAISHKAELSENQRWDICELSEYILDTLGVESGTIRLTILSPVPVSESEKSDPVSPDATIGSVNGLPVK